MARSRQTKTISVVKDNVVSIATITTITVGVLTVYREGQNNMFKSIALATLSILAATPGQSNAAARSDCPTEYSSYSLRLDPTIVARFVKISKVRGLISDLVFEVTWHKDGTKYWYIFDEGNSPYINLVSSTDPSAPDYVPPVEDTAPRPHGDTQYLALRENLSFDERVPKSGMKAPMLILLPRLPELRFDNPSGHSFFELSGCSK